MKVGFFIAGMQKGGTTALVEYLRQHPGLALPAVKEAHFFDDEALDWARPDYAGLHRHFEGAGEALCGDATPIYTYWPQALERLAAYNPGAKIIVLLRDPIARAYSHWAMESSRGDESLPFSTAIRSGRERVRKSPGGVHRTYSYVERGFYAPQLRRLQGLFPAPQVLYLPTVRLRKDPAAALAEVCRFLGVEPFAQAPQPRVVSPVRRDARLRPMLAADREHLAQLYREDLLETRRLTALEDLEEEAAVPEPERIAVRTPARAAPGAGGKKAVLVAGMHRSGTSALTRILNLRGCDLPKTLYASTFGNETGHWESEAIIRLDDEILESAGSAWDDWGPFDAGWLASSAAARFRARAQEVLREEFGDSRLFVLKEPRICRLLGFWIEALREFGATPLVVLPIRNPLDVAASLQARNGMQPAVAQLLWLRHVLDAEADSRGVRRAWMRFDDLFGEAQAVADKVGAGLGVAWPKPPVAAEGEIEAFVSPALRHHAHEDALLLEDPGLSRWIRGAFEIFGRWTRGDARPADTAELDRIRLAFDEAAPAFSGAFAAAERAVEKGRRLAVEKDEQIATLHGRLGESLEQVAALQEDLAERAQRIGALEQTVAEREAQAGALAQAVAVRDSQIATLYRSSSWRVTAPLRALSALLGRLPRNARRGLRLFGWLATGQFGRAGSAVLPYYRAHVPLRWRLKVPHGLRRKLQRRLDDGGGRLYGDRSFSEQFYLASNPDIAQAGLNPYEHYVRSGKGEGRLGNMPIDMLGSFDALDPAKETVLVVGHEGSRTGAPVLTYNLVLELLKKYNVVALFPRGGPILEACHGAGAVVVTLSRAMDLALGSVFAELLVRHVTDAARPKFALVNSVEARAVLAALANAHVPSITLIHEFAAYVAPGGIREAILWSGQVVFSAAVTRESVLAREVPDMAAPDFPVIPQGRCRLPEAGSGSWSADTVDFALAKAALRPPGFPAEGIVVLGAGAVQIRKGVDLFIKIAARVRALRPELPVRFVWIGKGYAPDTDIAYSMFLADQVARAGLQGHFAVVDEVADLAGAYALADLFLVSSRLDPMPNVAIDALSEGLPVVCFERTTGIAEVLAKHGLADALVAPYLDTHAAADKLVALMDSAPLREALGAKCAALGAASFDMGRYVAELEELAAREIERARQAPQDIETLLQAPELDLGYCFPGTPQSRETVVRYYVRSWANKLGMVKPLPGFHPGIYLERHGVAAPHADPFADYLRAGKPQGPWNFGLVTPAEPAASVDTKVRVALHVHAYYPELFPDVLKRLRRNRTRIDLLVSVTSEESRAAIAHQLQGYRQGAVDIQVVPNAGRDLGPFLTAFGAKIRAGYDFVGHLHTKKTVQHGADVGRKWYLFLLEHLLGGKAPMADLILARMARSGEVGMVFPDDPNAVGWTKNRAHAEPLAARLGLGPLPEYFAFPIGTMFWARVSSLAPVLALGLDWADYPPEPLPVDGTMLHALERLLPLVVERSGQEVLLAHVPGIGR